MAKIKSIHWKLTHKVQRSWKASQVKDNVHSEFGWSLNFNLIWASFVSSQGMKWKATWSHFSSLKMFACGFPAWVTDEDFVQITLVLYQAAPQASKSLWAGRNFPEALSHSLQEPPRFGWLHFAQHLLGYLQRLENPLKHNVPQMQDFCKIAYRNIRVSFWFCFRSYPMVPVLEDNRGVSQVFVRLNDLWKLEGMSW